MKKRYSQLSIMDGRLKAAYGGEHAWLEELKEYLTENLSFMRRFLEEEAAEIKLVEPE